MRNRIFLGIIVREGIRNGASERLLKPIIDY
jgi:hypothetical protein